MTDGGAEVPWSWRGDIFTIRTSMTRIVKILKHGAEGARLVVAHHLLCADLRAPAARLRIGPLAAGAVRRDAPLPS